MSQHREKHDLNHHPSTNTSTRVRNPAEKQQHSGEHRTKKEHSKQQEGNFKWSTKLVLSGCGGTGRGCTGNKRMIHLFQEERE